MELTIALYCMGSSWLPLIMSIREDNYCVVLLTSSIQPLLKHTAFMNAVAMELLFLTAFS
jgi:hypothetical protein